MMLRFGSNADWLYVLVASVLLCMARTGINSLPLWKRSSLTAIFLQQREDPYNSGYRLQSVWPGSPMFAEPDGGHFY